MLHKQHRYGLTTLETIVADFGDNLSPKTATVAEFGDYSRQCGQAFTSDPTAVA